MSIPRGRLSALVGMRAHMHDFGTEVCSQT